MIFQKKSYHQLMIAETGGSVELRAAGQRVGRYKTFGGVELYPTKEEKSARAIL